MKLDEMSRDELIAAVRALMPPAGTAASEHLLYDLHLQLMELMVQNRQLRVSLAELEQSRRRAAELYDLAPVAYCTLDRDGCIRDANLTCSAFLGLSREQLDGRPLAQLIAPEDRVTLRGHLERCFTEQARVTSEVRLQIASLGLVPFQLVSTAMLAPSGEALCCKTALTDISALKRADGRLRLLAAASAELSSSVEIKTRLAKMLRLLTPGFADLCFADVRGEGGGLERVEVAFADRSMAAVAQALQGPGLPTVHLTEPLFVPAGAREAVGQVVPLTSDRRALVEACCARSLILAPLLAGGRSLGLVCFVTSESSGRQFSQEDLEFACDLACRVAAAVEVASLYREAQRTARARQDALAVVSHDLKTPIVGIKLSLEMIKRTAPEDERRAAARYLDRIHLAAAQMEHLVDDLLDLGSIDSGRLVIDRQDACMLELIDEATGLVGALAQEKSITMHTPNEPRPLPASVDRHRLVQVLANLLGNAIKFSPARCAIRVEACVEGPNVKVVIADEGPGISPSAARHMFERYWQGNPKAHEGRGLGLFICKGIIEAHGGVIWIESVPGSGTRMQFTVPAAERAAAPPPDGHPVERALQAT